MSKLQVTRDPEGEAPSLEELRHFLFPKEHWNLAPKALMAAVETAQERGVQAHVGRQGKEWFALFEHEGQYVMMRVPADEAREKSKGQKTWQDLVAEGEADDRRDDDAD